MSNNRDGSDSGQDGPTIQEVDSDIDYKAVIDALADEKLQESLRRVKAPANDEESDGIEVIEVSEEQKAAFVKLHADMQRLSRRLKKAGWVEAQETLAKGKKMKSKKNVGTKTGKVNGEGDVTEKGAKKTKKLGGKVYVYHSILVYLTHRHLPVGLDVDGALETLEGEFNHSISVK